MQKLSFNVPKQTRSAAQRHDGHKEVVSLALLGIVASMTIVALVLLFNTAFDNLSDGVITGLAIEEHLCGPYGLIVSDAWYLDQLEKLNYNCLVGSDPRVWCCYKK